MRMWNVNVEKMCDKHLLGEHVEMHMFVGTIRKGNSIKGFIDGGLVEVDNIKKRHDELTAEMLKRGMRHNSPLNEILTYDGNNGFVNVLENEVALRNRCKNCKF